METRRKRRAEESIYNQRLNNIPEKLRKMTERVQGLKYDEVPQPELADHDSKNLDLAFVMDTTSSMSPFIHEAKNSIRKIVEEIVAAEKSDVQLALVEYRDHPPQDTSFVTRCNDFTHSPNTMKGWLANSSACGGGDLPEAVADALQDLLKLSWRENATKIGVCVSDAPPHGLGASGDGFPGGCPNGIDPVAVAHELAKKGVTLYVVGCEPSITPYKDFFMAIAHITGGQYVSLKKADLLSKIIIGGAREEISLNQLMAEVDTELQQRVAAGEDINEDMVTRELHDRWSARGEQVNQLQNKSAELESVHSNARAKSYAKCATFSAVQKVFKPANSSGGAGGFSFGSPPSASAFSASASSSGGGMFGGLFNWFGGSGSDAPRPAPTMAPPADDAYSCETSGVTYAQSSRLVSKCMSKYK